MDEMTFNEQLYRYIDGELDHQDSLEFKSFLEKNPLAQVQFENEMKFDKVIRNHMVREEAPYELRERIIDRLQRKGILDRLRETVWFKPLLSGIGTASVVLAFVMVLLHQPTEFTAFAQGVDLHIDQMHGTYPCEILTGDIEEAMAWFDQKLDFALIRPHIALDKAQLIGARIIQINGHKAAYFMYEVQGRPLSAFVMNMHGEPLERIRDRVLKENQKARIYGQNIKGFQAVLCYHKGNETGCMLVTDMTQDELLPLMG